MSHHAFRSLVVTVGLLWVATWLGCASLFGSGEPTASREPRATIVAVEGTSTTYHSRDWNGQVVTVRVPSQSSGDIKGKDVEGNVRATVTEVDRTTQRVKVRTPEGQTIVLAMAPDALATLRVGDPLLFTVPKPPR
jgi:hypothetical protein